MENFFMIMTIRDDSIDYDMVLNYVINNPLVQRVSIISKGMLIQVMCEDEVTRKKFISNILNSGVENIELFDILYEEFKPLDNT
ncbi:MAG: hypothetical protein ACP5OA_05740 [Candidatus Woesearchaeota archaeon]